MTEDANALNESIQYVTVVIGGQLFGLPISRVHDVFVPESITRVPLSRPEMAGVLNLRGRTGRAIHRGRRLHVPPPSDGGTAMAVRIEHKGESYGLLIDNVGEVLDLPSNGREPNPVNLDARWTAISGGVHRLNGQLMVILDVDRVLGGMSEAIAA